MRVACAACSASNQSLARFCACCGRPMNPCPVCGQNNRAAAHFCRKCRTGLHAGEPASPATPQPATPRAETLNSRYVVSRVIGGGGRGRVYLASASDRPSQKLALKEMRVEGASAQDVADFHREAQILEALQHPNIVRVFDRFAQDGREYLVMEYVEGHSLDRHALPLDDQMLLRVAFQLADALGYLHTQSPPIIYRDLKPANVMFEPSTGRIVLIDFGIARFYRAGQKGDTRRMGTEGYAAPEAYGRAQTDARSDVYSLGATLHALATAQSPSQSPLKLPHVRDLNPALPLALEKIIDKSVQLRPQSRFQTMRELQEALAHCGRQIVRSRHR